MVCNAVLHVDQLRAHAGFRDASRHGLRIEKRQMKTIRIAYVEVHAIDIFSQ